MPRDNSNEENAKKDVESKIAAINKDEGVSERNKEIIQNFITECKAESLSWARVRRYLFDLHILVIALKKDFDKADKGDIKNLVAMCESGKVKKKENEKQYSESTIYGFKVALKKFYRWLRGMEKCDGYPPEVRWIPIGKKPLVNRRPESLLTEDDILKLVSFASCIRDRAFIITLYESAARIGEMLSLRIKDAKFDKHGVVLEVEGKTGFRKIRCVLCTPYLKEWINGHPKNSDENSSLWVCADGKPLQYPAARKTISATAKRAKIKKFTNPHNFRRSRATFLANSVSDRVLMQIGGWKEPKVIQHYVYLSGRDVDSNVLKNVYGIDTDDDNCDRSKLCIKTCSKCGTINKLTDAVCLKCNRQLGETSSAIKLEEERQKADEILDKILEDEEFKALFLKKVKETAKDIVA